MFSALMGTGTKSSNLKADPGKSERSNHSSKRYSLVEPSPVTHLYSENHAQLHKIWLIGAQKARGAVEIYADSLQHLVGARNEHEMSQQVSNAGEILKRSVEDIINTQTRSAGSLISSLPLNQQNLAIEYWENLASQLRGYSDASMNTSLESIKHLADLTIKLWAVQKKLVDDIDRVYDRTVSNVR